MLFLELPTEIRLRIYYFILAANGTILCPQTRRSFRPPKSSGICNLSILRANHKIYEEAIGVLYGDSLIRYYTDLASSNRYIKSPLPGSGTELYLKQLRRLEICCNDPYSCGLGVQPPKAQHTTHEIKEKQQLQTAQKEEEEDEIANAIDYFNAHKCCLREVKLSIDFMQREIPENVKLMKQSTLWQGLAAMDVREKLTIQITTSWFMKRYAFDPVQSGLRSLFKRLALEKGWEEYCEAKDTGFLTSSMWDGQSKSFPMWTWTIRPKSLDY